MVYIKFIAREIGTIDNGRFISCGASNSDNGDNHRYFNFQRSLKKKKDTGIYFEFNGQGSGDYNRIQNCELTKTNLIVNLKYGPPNYTEVRIDVSLAEISGSEFNDFKTSLSRVFQGYEHLLQINI